MQKETDRAPKNTGTAASAQHPAVVYCEGAFDTTNGKTAHGLVRRSERYLVCAVVDSRLAGQDAGEVLDGRPSGIPIVRDVAEAVTQAQASGTPLSHFVMGVAPDGGRLTADHRANVARAVRLGLNVDSGLHDYLGDDPNLVEIARAHGARIRDIRRPPSIDRLHFFSGEIEQVTAPRIAVLGTDSAVGKRTTAWLLVDALRERGLGTELIGTGQTAWLQGARYSIVLDSLINDFVAGEIEHTIYEAFREAHPDVLVLEGQGSLLNPAYPGGFELLAAGRPAAVILQHAPGRKEYDGFPGYVIQPLKRQIEAVQVISDKPVVAITVNPEGLTRSECAAACQALQAEHDLPVLDPLVDGTKALVDALSPYLPRRERI